MSGRLPQVFCGGLVAISLVHGVAVAQDGAEGMEPSSGLHGGFRYRYEGVEQEGFTDDAAASTVRLRLNYQTDTWRNLSAFAETDYVGELFSSDFNSRGGSSPERNRYPVVADPEGFDLNQLLLELFRIDPADIANLAQTCARLV